MFKISMVKYFAFVLLILTLPLSAISTPESDQICGKWISSEKNIIVQIFKDGNEFHARIVWFNDDPSKPMEEWRDKHNPNPALRNRTILGMEVLRDLKYDADSHSWEDGMIYDAQHGREWNASAYINKEGLLKVKGYWHFKLFGKTMTFKRV